MHRLNKAMTLAGVVTASFALIHCASTTSNGGSGGAYQGTGGSTSTGGSAGSTSTGGSSGSTSTGGSAGAMNTGGSAGASTGGTAGAAGGGACSPNNPSACPGGKCGKPGALHPDTIYCPFSATDGGKNADCTPGTQHCCEGLTSSDVSVCDPLATTCPSGWTDWVCQQDSDCGAGKQCCATATFVKNSMQQCANYATGFHATQCETTCAAGEIHMCTATTQCAQGKVCTPFSTKGAQVGGCE